MRIRIEFGLQDGTETVNWFRDIKDFPRYMRYHGCIYEFVMYEQKQNDYVDYVFKFSSFNNFYWSPEEKDIHSFIEMFGSQQSNMCFCGAKFDKGNPDYHYDFCPKWSPKK